MNLPLSYEDALSKHPAEVAEVIRIARKSRSKFRNSDPATWKWEYIWSELIEGGVMSIREVLLSPPGGPDTRPLEERVNACLARCGVTLRGSGWWTEISSEVLREYHTEYYRKLIEEEGRRNAMTKEEVEEGFQESLRFLTGPRNKGFMAIKVDVDFTVMRLDKEEG